MKIGILALGLIGGSILKALEHHDVVAVTRNKKTLAEAKKYAVRATDNINELKDRKLIFVCTPMNKVLGALDKLENIVSKDTIVVDVCSLKEFVTEKERPYKFIGTHPMAGTEKMGFTYSFKELFQGANWVLTPASKASSSDISILKEIIVSMGAKPIIMDAQSHDRAAALISHMPMLLAQALVDTVMPDKEAQILAASGFRDMTRLALSNTELADDMITMNRENIIETLQILRASIDSLLGNNYLPKIEKISEFRKEMYNEAGKNISALSKD